MEPLGNAKWSRSVGWERYNAEGGDYFFFGCPTDPDTGVYDPKRFICKKASGHLLTVAPTRAGKGVSLIIPNLLCYRGSAIIIDPKGELAWITAPRRRELGQKVCIVDPWDQVNKIFGAKVGVTEEVSHFNPLSILKAGSRDLIDNLAWLADSLIITESEKDPHWDESARELVSGLMAYVVENPAYAPYASLSLVRKLLNQPNDVLERTIRAALEEVPDGMAAVKLGQFRNPEKAVGIASVISTARTQTGFLDNKNLRDAMEFSDFSFDEMREGGRQTTVYLVLPPHLLNAYARWLRLMVSIAIGTLQKGPLDEVERENLRIKDDPKEPERREPESAEVGEFNKLDKNKATTHGWDLLPDLLLSQNKGSSREIVLPEWLQSRQTADIEEWWAQQSLDVKQAAEKLHTNPGDLAKAKAHAYMAWHYSQKPKTAPGPMGPVKLEPLTELPPSLRPSPPPQPKQPDSPKELKVVWSDPEAQRAWMAKEAARMASLPVLFLLDEFGTIGRLGAISTGFGLAAGTGPGISIWAFVQDLNQLKRYYPDEFETFLGNVSSFISFGIMDAFTLGYISHQLGMRTIRYKTTGKTIQKSTRIRPETMEDVIGRIFGEAPKLEEDSGSSESSNTTEHVVAQPLASPDDIRKMHPQNCIVIGHDDPILCRRVDYYSDPTYSAWARPDPKYAKA